MACGATFLKILRISQRFPLVCTIFARVFAHKMETNTHYYIYTGLDSFLRSHFDGKVQKLSVNAGTTCPNRDGTLGRGGCTYCNNRTFNPDYCAETASVRGQLEEGKRFFDRKYPQMKYLAYFQAYTNTYGEVAQLRRMYEEALAVKGVVGLVVGTRPDCVTSEWLDYFERLSRETFVWIEYGIESVYDRTLQRVNRGHDFAATRWAVEETAGRGIPVGGHLILGLPGETLTDMVAEADVLSSLPLDTLKLHQLQIIRGTRMAREFAETPGEFRLMTLDDYISLVSAFLQRLRPGIAVERFVSQSPASLLISPAWVIKNYEFVDRLKKKMRAEGVCQGMLCDFPDERIETL